MNIREIRDLITSAFSSTGLKHESYIVNCPSPLTATIEGSEDAISVKFTGNLPTYCEEDRHTKYRIRSNLYGWRWGQSEAETLPRYKI